MSCQILVSNISSVARSEIIILAAGGHVWGRRETMSAWVQAGNLKEDWNYVFSLIIVTDKNKEDLDYLLDMILVEQNKYHFQTPAPLSDEYQELLNTGQISAPWSVVSQYIIERS